MLGLPASAYAYLGKTVPDFGDVAFAFPFDEIAGDMSPFDSGGLVEYVTPVRDRDDSEKRAFLNAFTFNTRRRRSLVNEYPGASRKQVQDYLRGARPARLDGPHDVWDSAGFDPDVAGIWNDENSWQAWTWEGRAAGRLAFATIHRWSCSPALHERIRRYAETGAKKREEEFLDGLLGSYVRGGVSQLVAGLRAEQLP